MVEQKGSQDEGYVRLRTDSIYLQGNLIIPEANIGLVVFAHGSLSDRHSPRNRYVAEFCVK